MLFSLKGYKKEQNTENSEPGKKDLIYLSTLLEQIPPEKSQQLATIQPPECECS